MSMEATKEEAYFVPEEGVQCLKLVLSILGEVVVYFRREIGAAGALAEEAEGEEVVRTYSRLRSG
jgi:hypothetical protein